MLNLNSAAARGADGRGGDGDEMYKVLVMDRFCFDVVTPLVRVNELRRHGVTLHLLLENTRQPIADVPAVYFVQPSRANVRRISTDLGAALYEAYHLNFSSSLPRPLLEELAVESVKTASTAKVARVFDQYLNFVSLGADVFSLAQKDAYVALNDADDKVVEAAIAEIVQGLFSVCATLAQLPIIRCPKGGAAEHIAMLLEKALRDHMKGKGNLFAESSMGGGGGTGQQRPLLCLFDRNFDLTTALQHVWTYQPLVHDVMGMRLNRVDIKGETAADTAAPNTSKKSYDLEDNDPFWTANAVATFPKVAEEVEVELARYKKAVEALNRQTDLGGDDSDMVDPKP